MRTLPGVLVLAMLISESASSAAPVKAQIPITAMAFSRPDVRVHVGDIVEWVNNDVVDHTSTAKGGRWDVSIAPGKRASATMTKAGTFDYYCRYHPNMIARVIVSSTSGK